ncbi:polysaccharide deacetylase family protein [Azospirillum picis]|uniref:Chitooligosaccharide deacetylase n=1 Tax=Azospirillum picis TaxID=488438 RepID=A0ABU0MJH1_9PROT|nr:polysaccharide deacetylase family protein [Azospirillum picis]MBP2299756.1 peptidoglycan/xylan/chitin deacetylase (PgdA/CDA1 family) [Azospirillum picis]MDQ0533552.1 peptidoglycan/xylan/chitin deacetylase (PgdA/CDA1 family) [Azospirillum picis]
MHSLRRAAPALLAILLLSTQALPAAAAGRQRSYAATHGAAPFATADLIPGSDIDLDDVDRSLPSAQVVALTIDDGPDANDAAILEILRQHHEKATFFFIGGKIAGHRDLARLVAASGNEIGSHTQGHPMMTDLPPARQEWNLAQAQAALAGIGVAATWFRPPYGDVDDVLAARALSHGMRTVLWTVDSRDWKGVDAETITRHVGERLAPGAVVLMHSTKAASLAALPAILEEGERRGYRFVTMSEWKEAMRRSAPSSVALLHPRPHPQARY